IDTALRCYQRTAWGVLKLTAAPMALVHAAVVFIGSVVLPSLFTTSSAGKAGVEIGEIAVTLFIGAAVCLPLMFMGTGLALGTVARATADALDDKPLDPEGAAASGRKTLLPVFTGILRTFAYCSVLFAASGLIAVIGMFVDRATG